MPAGISSAAPGTNDSRIDGLMSGVRWSGPVSFSDPDSKSDYPASYPEALHGFARLSPAQLAVARGALDTAGGPAAHSAFSVEGFTNLSLSYAGAGSGAGMIRIANSSDPSTAYAYYPGNHTESGDVFFGSSGRKPDVGNYHSTPSCTNSATRSASSTATRAKAATGRCRTPRTRWNSR